MELFSKLSKTLFKTVILVEIKFSICQIEAFLNDLIGVFLPFGPRLVELKLNFKQLAFQLVVFTQICADLGLQILILEAQLVDL